MFLITKRLFILFLIGTLNADDSQGSMKSFMEQHQVVPDIIPLAPELSLMVKYEGDVMVENGLELKPIQVKAQPSVSWNAESSVFYTLMMVSPDAPSRAEPTMKELQNWLVINIPGNDVTKGDILTEYVGAGPPKDTGLHRYIFLLYKQTAKITADEEHVSNTSAKRFYFSTQKFMEKYKLGTPIAGNFFQAQYDDYVPELHKQISITFDIKH